MRFTHVAAVLASAGILAVVNAQSTSSCGPAPSGSIQPSVASGYRLQVVATGLSRPRGLALDLEGRLLVVEAGKGSISAHTFNENNGCLDLAQSQDLSGTNQSLNHGIEMSPDGRTLYASSTSDVFAWDYDPQSLATSNQRTLINNMTGTDHTTRTLLLSRRAPGMLTVARGSLENIDIQATTLSSGISQVRAFNISDIGDQIYSYDRDGTRLGWGLRNEVGIGEHPVTGGIWGVENSADQLSRMGVDIHQNNPAEELNFLGYLNGTVDAQQGTNFGYPWCFTAWDVSALPNNGNLTVGRQFAIDPSSDSGNTNKTDEYCAAQTPPRLAFQAHMAPLDIKFNNSGTEAWITFHGSWDRDVPTGYKLSVVSFNAAGEPSEPSNSTTAALDIVSNRDIQSCPDNCLRPAAMVIDPQGRIFMSSDASGEIYLVTQDTGSTGTTSSSPTPSGVPSGTGSGSGASSTSSAASTNHRSWTAGGGFKMYETIVLLASVMMALL